MYKEFTQLVTLKHNVSSADIYESSCQFELFVLVNKGWLFCDSNTEKLGENSEWMLQILL